MVRRRSPVARARCAVSVQPISRPELPRSRFLKRSLDQKAGVRRRLICERLFEMLQEH